jgi:hypothetical protein
VREIGVYVELCPVAGFDISSVETYSSAPRELIN